METVYTLLVADWKNVALYHEYRIADEYDTQAMAETAAGRLPAAKGYCIERRQYRIGVSQCNATAGLAERQCIGRTIVAERLPDMTELTDSSGRPIPKA